MSDVWPWWDEGQDSDSVDEDARDEGVNRTEDRKELGDI